MGRFFFTLMSALGEFERHQIGERTKAAMGHMRRQGRRISRHVPYGYDLDVDGKTLVVNAGERARITAKQRARKAGKSYQSIAATLNEEGVTTTSTRVWP